MNYRIKALTELTLNGDMFPETRKTDFDRKDLLLPKMSREAKRLYEYILNQEPVITRYSKMTGFFRFDGSVVGDAFNRSGHKYTSEVMAQFYLKTVDNLSTMEWQHATADYELLLKRGIRGIIEDIDKSMESHTEPEETEFLEALKLTAKTMILWAKKCSLRAKEYAEKEKNPEYRENLLTLSSALRHVPEHAPRSFYEAVLSIYICFGANPDSAGTLDRYLSWFYEEDMRRGVMTYDEAKEYLQELFLMFQTVTPPKSANFKRGGQSHFCIGGYLPDGSDGFCETSRLIVEALMDLPTFIPQITFRWTKETPHEIMRYMMASERSDRFKRIAFTNDEKRLKCFTEICGIPYSRAVGYTMIGCNEPAFLGSITGGNSKINILRSMETLFHRESEKILNVFNFDEFYSVYEKIMLSELEIAYEYDDKYNRARAEDINYISSLFTEGCIENAKSLTRGGGNTVIVSPMILGITNVIDSLIVVRQFVFDEKLLTMEELQRALACNWQGFEEKRNLIINSGDFFGNDTPRSNDTARRLYDSFYRYLKDKTNLFGYYFLVGDILGYNEHHKWFGEKTKATPDGRYDGDYLKFCIGQSEGRDRAGLTALLNSVATLDPTGIACGSTATNITLDEALIKDDESFEKLVYLFEAYFRMGGVHFQLNYASKEELLAAREDPGNYRNLRVRVTGFSDFFVNLAESIQDDIIERTQQTAID